MFKTIFNLASIVAFATIFGVTSANAESGYESGVVAFDDLANFSNIGVNYSGFKWGSGIYAVNSTGNSGYAVFSNNSANISRIDGQAFYFDGADFFLRPGADTNDFSLVLYGINGETVYNGLTEKFGRNKINFGDPAKIFQAMSETPDGKLGSAYSGLVTGVAIAWDNQSWGDLGMDNFRFRALSSTEISVTPVPEPENYAMLLAGLGIIGFIVHRRKIKQA